MEHILRVISEPKGKGAEREAATRLRSEGGTKDKGKVFGIGAFEAFFLLISNIATANSSLFKLPVFVISERSQICAKTDSGSLEFIKNLPASSPILVQ